MGEGVSSSGQLKPEAIRRTLTVLKSYRLLCDQNGVQKILAVGTQALRLAGNAKTFLAEVKKECGFDLQIISGEREAELTWKAASTDFGADSVVVDIGGGSTEIISCDSAVSLPVGTVVLTEQFCHSDPVTDQEFQDLKQEIKNQLSSHPVLSTRHSRTLLAVAGTATTLAAIHQKMHIYHHSQIHGSTLPLSSLRQIIQELKSKTIEERKKILGLHPKRADVILSGAVLLEQLAEKAGVSQITISDRGLRWGLAYESLETAGYLPKLL